MNRRELIANTADITGLSRRTIEDALDGLLQEIQRAVISGDKVSLTGFGTIGLAHRGAYTGRNPSTGESLQVAPKSTPKLTPAAWWVKAANDVKQSGGGL